MKEVMRMGRKDVMGEEVRRKEEKVMEKEVMEEMMKEVMRMGRKKVMGEEVRRKDMMGKGRR